MVTLKGEWNLACGLLVENLPAMHKALALVLAPQNIQTNQILGESSLMS